jgi:type IV secretion system protein TrbJ
VNRPIRLIHIRSLLASTAVAAAFTVAVPTATLTMLTEPARAWRIVYDPTNYKQNLLSAARALEQIQNQVTSLQNEAQMLINQAKNLASLPTSVLSEIEGNFSEMKSLLGEAEKLAYSVEEIDKEFASTFQDFAGDRTSAELVQGARQRWQDSLSAFEHSLKTGAVAVGNIDGTRTQTSALVDASKSAVGILQATQAGNELLAVQTRQVADLTAMLAAQGRADALDQARQAAAQEQAREQFGRFMTARSYSPSSVKMFHD